MILITLRPRQNYRHFPDDISKRIFLNKKCCVLMKISLRFVEILGAGRATSHYLIQWWLSLITHTCISRSRRVKNYHMCYICQLRVFPDEYHLSSTKHVEGWSTNLHWKVCFYKESNNEYHRKCRCHLDLGTNFYILNLHFQAVYLLMLPVHKSMGWRDRREI